MLKLWLIYAFMLFSYDFLSFGIMKLKPSQFLSVVCHNTSVCKRIITPHDKDGLCASTAGGWHDYSRVHSNSMATEMLEGWGIQKGSNNWVMIWLQASSGYCVRSWKSVVHCTSATELPTVSAHFEEYNHAICKTASFQRNNTGPARPFHHSWFLCHWLATKSARCQFHREYYKKRVTSGPCVRCRGCMVALCLTCKLVHGKKSEICGWSLGNLQSHPAPLFLIDCFCMCTLKLRFF
jgi:hypothetical protein